MISLGVFAAMAIAYLCANAAVMAVAAGWVGSPRGRFGPALAIAMALAAVGLAFTAAAAWLPVGPGPAGVAGLGLTQLAVDFLVVRGGFRLSTKRSFAPFGGLLAVSVAELAVAVLLIRPHVVEAFVLPTNSMAPTLVAADRIAVVKFAHPRRWDVVAYHATATEVFCKRIVGLPGETLTFDGNGGITVDGVAAAMPPVLAGRCHAVPTYAAPGGQRYADGVPIRLGPRQVFLIGDNVNQSYDSRMMGPADVSALIGVADLAYWPPTHARLLPR